LLLALLTLPLPWLEVRCQSSGATNVHYTQTGAEMLVNRCTRLDQPVNPGPIRRTTPNDELYPGRLSAVWLWFLTVAVGVIVGLAGRSFVPSLISLILSCASVVLLLLLFVVIVVEEAANSLSFTGAPMLAFVACLAAMAGSIVSFVITCRASRSLPDPEYEQFG
jgi:hypothetical protein